MLRSFVKITVLLGIIGTGVWVLYEAQQKLSQSGSIVANGDQQSESPDKKSSENRELAFNANDQEDPFGFDSNQQEPDSFANDNGETPQPESQPGENPFFADEEPGSQQNSTNESGGIDFNERVTSSNETENNPTFPQVANNSESFENVEDIKDREAPSQPGLLKLPDAVEPLPSVDNGPQFGGTAPEPNDQPEVKDDPFGSEEPLLAPNNPVADKKMEAQDDPFGDFEEQQSGEQPRLPVASAKEPAPLPVFPDAAAKKRLIPAPVPQESIPGDTVVIKKRTGPETIQKSAFAEEEDLPPAKENAKPVPLVMEDRDQQKVRPPVNKFQGSGTIDKVVPRGENHPHLTIEKIAPANAVLGQPMVYSIVVRNKGKSTANKVVVEDRIPKGTELDGTIPRAELTSKKLIWKLGSLKPGEEQTIRVRVIPRSAGQIGSIATVNFVSEIAAATTVTAPKLKLDLTGPNSATIGEPVVFTFRVLNTGSADAHKVIIRNLIPKGLQHPDGDDLEYEVGTLPPGKSEEIKLTMTAISEGVIQNRAVVTATGDVREEATATLNVEGPILSISRSGPKRRYLGRSASFKNDVKNESSRDITLATITETVPREFKFLRASGGGVYNPQSRQVVWQISQLGAGESKRVEVILACTAHGAAESQVTAVVNNIVRAEVASETVIEGYPKLQTVIAGADEPVQVGEQVTYRFQVNNKGTANASNVKVGLTVPQQLQFVAVKGAKAIKYEGNQIAFTPVESISSKGEMIMSVTFKAVSAGKGHVGIHAQGNHMSRAITHEEEVIVYGN